MRLFAKLAALFILLFVGGFFVFAATLPQVGASAPAAALARKGQFDRAHVGIVALTGGRGARIERAIDLFQTGVADRVLISGTNPQTRKADLTVTGSAAVLECCVDLGPRAQTTIGNAAETRDWAQAAGYRAIFLVTDTFHMPRARMELAHAAPDLVVIGVPVPSARVPETEWFHSPDAWRMLGIEYLKFLATTARTLF